MKLDHSARELEFRTSVRKSMWLLLALSIATNLVLAVIAVTNKTTHRETLVPPSINKGFWIDGETLDPAYMEQMGKFLLDLALNNTPVNCEMNRTALLKYVGSGSYSAINTQQSANCKIILAGRISTFFAAQTIAIKSSTREVIFVGATSRWINDKKLPDKQQAYRLKFGYSGGRIYLQELLEVDVRAADPFSPSAVKNDVIERMATDLAIQDAEEVVIPVPPTPASAPAVQPASTPKP